MKNELEPERIEKPPASVAVLFGRITPLFQPIEHLQTGACRGFEALARLSHEGRLVSPHSFLLNLAAADRLSLFGAMLGESIALLKRDALKGRYVSINVEISLLAEADFVDVLQHFLERSDFQGERLVVELLENEDVADFSRLHVTLETMRRLGISIALDDIGSGYASMAKLRDLPIDILKLDRSFSRDLEMHPEDLTFVQSMLSLAAGLGKPLIVEGIETAEVYDALRVMGIDLGQGYVIAPPMPASEIEGWLATRVLREPSQVPNCLLGAYASHLTVVEACRVLRRQPLPIAWMSEAHDPVNCVIGRLFGKRGWHETAFGEAHRAFHSALAYYDTDVQRWSDEARRFGTAMAEAITAKPQEMRCERMPDPRHPTPPETLAVTARRAAAG